MGTAELKASEAAAPDACGTCRFYAGQSSKSVSSAAIAGIDLRGMCHLFPTVVKKSPEDWCGQHEKGARE